MSEKKVNLSTIIIVSVFSVLILTGTGIGIWLGVLGPLGNHPDPEWNLMITGNLTGDDYNYTMAEILEMPTYQKDIFINKNPTTNFTAIFVGVQVSYLLELIAYDASAVNVTFIAADGYSWGYSILDADNETYVLAYAQDGAYYEGYLDDGDGYLYLIVPQAFPGDWNKQRCVKNIAEIHFD